MRDIRNFLPANSQGRNAGGPYLRASFGCAQIRSLSTAHAGFAPLRICGKFIVALLLLVITATANAQEPETIRINTRVVFLDALVKDKRTGIPINDLKLENFQVLDDGHAREISYFTREGQARKPLALVIILDCREDGAGRFLKRPEILKAMGDELSKLPPGDEVAIVAMNIGEEEKRIWVTRLTSDRMEINNALARVPAFVEKPEFTNNGDNNKKPNDSKGAVTISSDDLKDDGTKKTVVENDTTKAAQKTPKPEQIVETETIKGKNGAVVTRTLMKDGSVNVKRTSGNGHMVIELDDIYDMAAAVRDATRTVETERPNSQTAIVWVSDGIAPIFFEDRDATEKILIKSNAIFSSLTVELRTLFKFLMPIGKPIAGWAGVSLYGSAKRLAQQSGGEAVRVSRVSDYGAGLAKIVGNLTARYSLGFKLDESEKDDGRMHNLDVRVKAQDVKGKLRKLEVSARKGYYMPTTDSHEAKAQ